MNVAHFCLTVYCNCVCSSAKCQGFSNVQIVRFGYILILILFISESTVDLLSNQLNNMRTTVNSQEFLPNHSPPSRHQRFLKTSHCPVRYHGNPAPCGISVMFTLRISEFYLNLECLFIVCTLTLLIFRYLDKDARNGLRCGVYESLRGKIKA